MFAKFFKRLMQASLIVKILRIEMQSKFKFIVFSSYFFCPTQTKIFFEFAMYKNAIHGTGLGKDPIWKFFM